jgi:predicted enzyme related to lactoylglutathione lyase
MRTALRGSLIMCNVPTTNSQAARRFYGSLLGDDSFARGLNDEVESYFMPISEDGIDLMITQRFDDSERLTCYFAVEDLKATLEELRGLDGRVVVEPQPVKIAKKARRFYQELGQREGIDVGDDVGTMAVILDPDGNHVGLMQLEPIAEKHFSVGKYRNPITDEQSKEHQEAVSAGRDAT